MTARSYLFVPGDRRDMLEKVAHRGADAVIADLEDAVAPARKQEARSVVAEWVSGLQNPPFEVWVRINPAPLEREADVAAVVGSAPTGIMVPKVSSVADVVSVGETIARCEEAAGIRAGQVELLPIIETAHALLAVNEIARAPRVHQLMIGELDLAADLGIDPTDDDALLPLRMSVVVASAAAGILAPLGPVAPDYRDLDALRRGTARMARLGFGARPAIHPAQVGVFNEVLAPSAEEVARAERLLALYDRALAEGRGAIVDDDGRMVDEAVVKVARRTLARAHPRDGRE